MSIEASTQVERTRMLDAGMREITRTQLVQELEALGYEINPETSISYTNTYNAVPYKARAVGIKDTVTGLSFANVNACKKNLGALQSLRLNTFVYYRGRILEI